MAPGAADRDRPAGRQAPTRLRLVVLAAYAAAVAVDAAVTVVRLRIARGAQFAGHADPSFYYQLARNLAQGRGLTVDFVWHYLTMPPDVHHYALDYWQPLPSLLLAAAMRAGGDTRLATALTATVLAAALVPVAAALLARTLSGHALVPPVAMGLTALVPQLSSFSVGAESGPFYAVFVLLTLALACARTRSRLRWPLAGITAGGAYLCRNDGLLLIALLAVALAARALAAWRRDRRVPWARAADLGLFCAAAAVTVAPSLWANLRGMGRLLPATTRLPWLVTYEDMFAVGHRDGLRAVLADGPGTALAIRSERGFSQLQLLVTRELGIVLTLCLLVLLLARLVAHLRSRRGRPRAGRDRFGWPLVAASAALTLAFHALVTPVASASGGWRRSLVAYLPVLTIAVVELVFWATRPRLLRVGRAAAVAALALPGLLAVHSAPQLVLDNNNAAGMRMLAVGQLLREASPIGRPVVMARNTWELTEVTGFPAVQIPNNDLCTILRTAQRFRARLLVLPADRPALADPAALRAAGFTLAARRGGPEIWRIPAPDRACRAAAP
ncbi:MAG TPA: hypothetical protein VKG45_02670 [Actinomycetes bacterium]|nr:hypothetical protein [Actinomycetes bacterium]